MFSPGIGAARAAEAASPLATAPATRAGDTGTAPGSARELAAREQQAEAQGLADFQGGDDIGIYIGGGTLTVALLIVLLIVLL